MVQLLISDVMQAMAPVLDNTQLQALQTTLRTVLAGFRIEECTPASPDGALFMGRGNPEKPEQRRTAVHPCGSTG